MTVIDEETEDAGPAAGAGLEFGEAEQVGIGERDGEQRAADDRGEIGSEDPAWAQAGFEEVAGVPQRHHREDHVDETDVEEAVGHQPPDLAVQHVNGREAEVQHDPGEGAARDRHE
jgi:hypothetical protein